MRRLLLTLVAIALCSRATAIAGEEPAIEWRPWSDSVFASDGGLRHDEEDVAGPYLGDTLSMGRGFLTLYAYPALERSAAFRCTETNCSPPVYLPEQLTLK